MIVYRLRTDGGDPSPDLSLRAAVRLLGRKLARHPAGRHYRVDGGVRRTRVSARRRMRRLLRASKPGQHHSVLVDFAAHHTYTIKKVDKAAPEPVGAQKAIAWCEDRVGSPYVLGALWPPATDCSGMTRQSVESATDGRIVLDHYAASQAADKRLTKVELKDAQPGDLMFFHSGAHVAMLHHWDGSRYFVIDEEPGSETYNGAVIPGGLHIRPGAPGYYVGEANLDSVSRVPW